MSLSLNEVEALALKAARGAGYAWGLAQEAAKATRWLSAYDFDACAELAALLIQWDGRDYHDTAPSLGPVWTSPTRTLCPIATGCTLSDHADHLGTPVHLENVVHPMLLVPFAASSARYLERTLALTWPGAEIITNGTALCIVGEGQPAKASVTVAPSETDLSTAPGPTATRANPAPDSLAILHRFAHRTYAPATEASRRLGAGAGTTDND